MEHLKRQKKSRNFAFVRKNEVCEKKTCDNFAKNLKFFTKRCKIYRFCFFERNAKNAKFSRKDFSISLKTLPILKIINLGYTKIKAPGPCASYPETGQKCGKCSSNF